MRKKDKAISGKKQLYSVQFVISGKLCKCEVIARGENEAMDEMFKVYPLATIPGAKLVRELKDGEAMYGVGIIKSVRGKKADENN